MRLFYLENIKPGSKIQVIKGTEARHIYKVLRMKPGDIILLMDNKGNRYKSTIKKIAKDIVEVFIEDIYLPIKQSPIKIILCISLIRAKSMDLIIQKTSELGVDIIQPFYSERTIINISKDKIKSKIKHWKEVAKSAAKQSGRVVPANILKPLNLKDMINAWGFYKKALKLLLWERESILSIKDILIKTKDAKEIIGIIGPEGGFTQKEIEIFKNLGFYTISMGKRILRAETAAITFVAIVQYELGDLGII